MDNIQKQLAAPFADSDIEWRLQWTDDEKGAGVAVPYVTNRAIQNRLDRVVGIARWKNEYAGWHSDGKKASQICGISIYFEDRKEWITKYDGAENSDIEPIKGGLSDSMKRAAVQWGIGRYLYNTNTVYVQTEKRSKTTYIKASEQSKLDKAHQVVVALVFGTSPAQEVLREPAQKGKAAAKPNAAAKPEATAPPPKPAPQKTEPPAPSMLPLQGVYQIVAVALSPAIREANNTNLQLKDTAGNVLQAYLKGENSELQPGVWILDTVITQKTRNGVVFNILESFRLQKAAA